MTYFKIARTRIVYEILHPADVDPSNFSLAGIEYECDNGEWSGFWSNIETVTLTHAEFLAECERQGTDPAFFDPVLEEGGDLDEELDEESNDSDDADDFELP